MTQAASLKKTNPALKLFGFTIKKNLGFTALASVIVLLFNISTAFNSVSSRVKRLMGEELFEDYIPDVICIQGCILAVICCVFLVVLLSINFGYLYRRSASDMYHAIPLTRNELLFSRFFASFVCSLIPLAIGYIGFAVIGLHPLVVCDMAVLLKSFLFCAGAMLAGAAFALIPFISAGSVFDAIVSFLTINVGPPIIIMLIFSMCGERLYGFSGSLIAGADGAAKFTNPYLYSIFALSEYLLHPEKLSFPISPLAMIIFLCIAAALLLFCSYLYNIRKSETAGDAYSFGFMPYIISFIISFVCYFILKGIFTEADFDIVFGVFGALLGGAVYNIISNRGFKKIKKAILPTASALAAILIAALCISFDVFGYESYIPENGKIKSATVNYIGAVFNAEAEDEAAVAMVTDLHKAILDNRDKPVEEDRRTSAVPNNYSTSRYITVSYTLKDGTKVERGYHVLESVAIDEKQSLINNLLPRSIEEAFANYKGKDFSISGRNDKTNDYFDCEITREEATGLIDAYIKDIKKTKLDKDWNSAVTEQYDIDGAHIHIVEDSFGNPVLKETDRYYQTIRIHKDYDNTRAFIEALNLEERQNMLETEEYAK